MGETYLGLLDLKLDKFRDSKNNNNININLLKKVEINKINSYCQGGLIMFGHFTKMYSLNTSKDNNESNTQTDTNSVIKTNNIYNKNEFPTFEWTIDKLVNEGICMNPNYESIIQEEVRPYLNAHFLFCRILSKIINTSNIITIKYLEICQHRYTWISQVTRTLCHMKNLKISDVFEEEMKICEEMSYLLPSKIMRMKQYNETGLNL